MDHTHDESWSVQIHLGDIAVFLFLALKREWNPYLAKQQSVEQIHITQKKNDNIFAGIEYSQNYNGAKYKNGYKKTCFLLL